jgi:hypothetical protein
LIDFFERAAKHAVHPELNALRKELISALNSDADRQDKWRTTFLRAHDEENYGSELTDFAQRAAKETMRPKLIAFRHEVLSSISDRCSNVNVMVSSTDSLTCTNPQLMTLHTNESTTGLSESTELWKCFRGQPNTKPILEEKAKVVAHLVVDSCGSVLNIAASCFKEIRRVTFKEEDSNKVILETAIFLVLRHPRPPPVASGPGGLGRRRAPDRFSTPSPGPLRGQW